MRELMARNLRNERGMSRLGTILLIVASLVVAGGLGAFVGYFASRTGMNWGVKQIFERPFDGRQVVRILVLGEDNSAVRMKGQRGLSDTIILASIDLQKKRVAAISIPRDTRVDRNGYGKTSKINAAFSQGGPVETARIVSELTGVPPDYYVVTNVEGFKGTVDAVGGVEIDVEKNMDYTDRWGGLYIHLRKGLQTLNGDKAMQYVRFRHDTLGDITRIQRQQKFLKALAKKALEPGNLPKLPQTMDAVAKNLRTDMSPKDLLYLAKFVSKLDMSKVEMATLPGTPETLHGVSYWIPDANKTAEVVQELFFPRAVVALPTIEVLNGSGIVGAAATAAEMLKKKGYDVKSVGNAPKYTYDSSEVINHRGSDEGAQQIASLLNSQIIKREQDKAAPADVTVIVGRDFAAVPSGT